MRIAKGPVVQQCNVIVVTGAQGLFGMEVNQAAKKMESLAVRQGAGISYYSLLFSKTCFNTSACVR